MKRQLFLLSPASTVGRRAQLLFNEQAEFPLARTLRESSATLGEVFSFLSGLYFRGKLEYARAFGRASRGAASVLVITSNRGLVSPDARITLTDLRAFAATPIDSTNAAYHEPLLRDARAVAGRVGGKLDVVLLGSIASGKYVDVLQSVFGERLLFPQEFVGRGDMSRGGLLLRCVDAGAELTYVPVAGAVRRGQRPPRLSPR